MSVLNKLVFLLLLASFYGPAYAAVDSAEFSACDVFSEAEEGKGDKKEGGEEEEEPDCE